MFPQQRGRQRPRPWGALIPAGEIPASNPNFPEIPLYCVLKGLPWWLGWTHSLLGERKQEEPQKV